MSMKRAKPVNRVGRTSSASESLGFGPAPAKPQWEELVASRDEGEFKPYQLSAVFARNDLVAHSKFGKGIVLMVDGTKVEILFQDGARKLGHMG